MKEVGDPPDGFAKPAVDVIDRIATKSLSDPVADSLRAVLLGFALSKRKELLEVLGNYRLEPRPDRVSIEERVQGGTKMTLVGKGHEELVDPKLVIFTTFVIA